MPARCHHSRAKYSSLTESGATTTKQHKDKKRPKPLHIGTTPAATRRFEWVVPPAVEISEFCVIVELWYERSHRLALA